MNPSDMRQHLPAIAATSLFWIALFVAYALFGQRHPQAQPIKIIPPTSPPNQAEVNATTARETTCAPAAQTTPQPVRVYVSGAVATPGVYRLPPESLVTDAIDMAGGPASDADLVAINLAHPLSDGEQIYVPRLEEAIAPPPPVSRTGGLATDDNNALEKNPVDLNTATQEMLETLPGIGPAMAQRIIEGRPYHAIEDIMTVKGIGEAKFAKIKPFITVR